MDVCVNEQFLIYCSINPIVNLLDLETLCTKQETLNFAERGEEGNYFNHYGLMSVKFSGDTKEIVAGSKRSDILIYDLLANRVSTRVANSHDDEINSVCFANRM